MRSDITITREKLSEGPGPLVLDRTRFAVIKRFHYLITIVVCAQSAALLIPKHHADREMNWSKTPTSGRSVWRAASLKAIRQAMSRNVPRRQVLCLRQASRAAYVSTAGGGK
jgi:hypothetical protein